jgi:hypothetical protein
VISRPTTEQLLLDCAKELMRGVLPAVSDPPAIIRIYMIEQVLRSAAIRSANEIAWMREEIPAIEAYGRAVHDAVANEDLTALLARVEQADEMDLTLNAVAERYFRAGEVLASALEVAVLSGLDDLRQQGEQIVVARMARERDVMAGWSPTGR